MRARGDALLAIADVHDYPTWRALAYVWQGMAMVGAGEAAKGLARLEEGFDLYQGLSAPPVFWSGLLLLRASVLGMAGRPDDGLRYILEAKATLQEGDPLGPDVDIAYGELLLLAAEPDAAGAEAAFQRAADRGRRSRRPDGGSCGRSPGSPACARDAPSEGATLQALRALCEDLTEGHDDPHVVAARALTDATVASVVDEQVPFVRGGRRQRFGPSVAV